MRNLFLFIVKISNFLLFIVLEVVAFILIFRSHPYQHSSWLSSANRMAASVNKIGTGIEDYFQLKEQNLLLSEQNAELLNRLAALQQQPYRYLSGKVVDMTTHKRHNYLTVNIGKEDGVRVGMGVVSQDGVVGTVCAVSRHFALVVPVIHVDNHLSCRLAGNRYIGFSTWEGGNPGYVMLSDIGRHVSVQQGDTVVTSGLTDAFPEGLAVGVVDRVAVGDGENYQDIRLRLAVDYKKLEFVDIVVNSIKAEMDSLYLKHAVD